MFNKDSKDHRHRHCHPHYQPHPHHGDRHRHRHRHFHHQVLSQSRGLPRAPLNLEVDLLRCCSRPPSPPPHHGLPQVEQNLFHSRSRNRVAIAIELIEEGSIACGQMLTTLFFPPLPFLFQVLFYPLVPAVPAVFVFVVLSVVPVAAFCCCVAMQPV